MDPSIVHTHRGHVSHYRNRQTKTTQKNLPLNTLALLKQAEWERAQPQKKLDTRMEKNGQTCAVRAVQSALVLSFLDASDPDK